MSTAEYQRKWRASKGARTGAHGPEPSAPCGTVSAYKRHLRNGEPRDAACREAWNEYQRIRYHNIKEPDADTRFSACGTVSAHKLHVRRGEPIDAACRDAWNEYRANQTPTRRR